MEYDIYSTDEDLIKDHIQFIRTFKALEVEDIFKDNMVKFIDIMVNKINNISSFDTIIDLIRVEKIKDKIKEYLEKLKNKYELVVKNEIEKLSDDKAKKPVEIIAKFVKLLFEQEKNIDFLKNNIKKLKICPLIYNQLLIICKDDERYDIMRNFIFDQYLNNINYIDNIIVLIDDLMEKDREKFLKDLMEKCRFTENEFYSAEENNKINFLCSLYEKKKLEKISGDIEAILNQIIIDIDKEEIDKRKLEKFFKNPEELVKRRLELIKTMFCNFNPKNAYYKLRNNLEGIKKDIEVLSHIKRSLSVFLREKYQNEIRDIEFLINKLENIKNPGFYSIYSFHHT